MYYEIHISIYLSLSSKWRLWRNPSPTIHPKAQWLTIAILHLRRFLSSLVTQDRRFHSSPATQETQMA